MSLFNDRIYVVSDVTPFSAIGMISGQSGMIVNHQRHITGLQLTSMSEGNIVMTGNGGQTYYSLNHLVSIKESNATGTPYFYPTGSTSYPFGHA